MKHQQVTIDFVGMMFTACSYLALAGAVWVFLRLLQACFWLPRHLKKQNDVQQMLEEKIDGYERYILECEDKEKAELMQNGGLDKEASEAAIQQSEKWKERRECLDLLKKELNNIREGGNAYDWDKLLEDELKINMDMSELEEEETCKVDASKDSEKSEENVQSETNVAEAEKKKDK